MRKIGGLICLRLDRQTGVENAKAKPLGATLAEGVSAIAAVAVFQNIAVDHFAKGSANFTTEGCPEEGAQGSTSNCTEQGAGWAHRSAGSQSEASAS